MSKRLACRQEPHGIIDSICSNARSFELIHQRHYRNNDNVEPDNDCLSSFEFCSNFVFCELRVMARTSPFYF